MPYPKGRPHPKLIGDRTTAKILARLVDVYECVLLPFGENQRYDLVVDDGARLLRIQCKTGRLRNGAIGFNTCSSTYHHPNRDLPALDHHPYYGQADFFGVYCPETEGVYLVPVSELGHRMAFLRIEAPRNSQERRIRWARDYELSEPRDVAQMGVERPNDSATLFEAPALYAV